MVPFAPLCAFVLLAAAPESGTITITTSSQEAAADYVEAFDQLFAGHGDLARAAATRALSRDPNLLLAQALLYLSRGRRPGRGCSRGPCRSRGRSCRCGRRRSGRGGGRRR